MHCGGESAGERPQGRESVCIVAECVHRAWPRVPIIRVVFVGQVGVLKWAGRRRPGGVQRVDQSVARNRPFIAQVQSGRRNGGQTLKLRVPPLIRDVAILGGRAVGALHVGLTRTERDRWKGHPLPQWRRRERAHEHTAIAAQDEGAHHLGRRLGPSHGPIHTPIRRPVRSSSRGGKGDGAHARSRGIW